jgi:1,4-dihydroxy-2-naphthoate octaprenyltransferase
VNNLLLLNQIPDRQADKEVGRFNILMQITLEQGNQVFAAFTGLAYISLG